MDITIYGTATSGHQMVVSIMSDILLRAHIPFSIREVTDVAVFLQKGLESVPAIQMDDQLIYGLKSNGSFSNSLRAALMRILSTENYGDLPQVILPVDFSDTAINALAYGHRLATDMGAVTKALYAYVPDATDVIATGKGQEELLEEKKEALDHLAQSLNTDWASDILKASMVDPEFVVGFPAEQIIASADRNDAALIVIGTTGASKSKKIFGSVSQRVMQEAQVPVLLVPQQAKYRGMHHIAYAFQDERIDMMCIHQLIDLATYFDSHIHLTQVVKPGRTSTYDPLRLITTDYPAERIHLHTIEDDHDPARALSTFAIDHDIDILAVGSKQKTFFDNIFSRSTSKWLAVHSQVPILVLK